MEDNSTDDTSVRPRAPHIRTSVTVFIVGFLYASLFLMDVSYNAVAYDTTRSWVEWIEVRRMTQISFVFVGILAYALFALVFERCRRKTCLYLVCVSHVVTSLLLLYANTHEYWLLHVSRAFSAVSGAGAAMSCVIYVSEIAPNEFRGGLLATHKLLYSLAEFIPIFMYVGHFRLEPLSLSGITFCVSTLFLIWIYVGVPESPIYFLRKEDLASAKHSLEILRGNEANVSQEIADVQRELRATRSDFRTTTSIFQDCTNRRTLKFSCIAFMLYLTRVTAGISIPRFEIESIPWRLPDADIYVHPSKHSLIIDMFLIIFGKVLAIVLCDRIGRKILLLISIMFCTMTLVGRGICLYVYEQNGKWDTIEIAYSGFSTASIFGFYLGIGTLSEVLIADIFPPKILNTQIAILGTFNLCVDSFVHFETYASAGPLLSLSQLIWPFGGMSFIGALVILYFLPETKCRPTGYLLKDREESILFSNLRQDGDEDAEDNDNDDDADEEELQ